MSIKPSELSRVSSWTRPKVAGCERRHGCQTCVGHAELSDQETYVCSLLLLLLLLSTLLVVVASSRTSSSPTSPTSPTPSSVPRSVSVQPIPNLSKRVEVLDALLIPPNATPDDAASPGRPSAARRARKVGSKVGRDRVEERRRLVVEGVLLARGARRSSVLGRGRGLLLI